MKNPSIAAKQLLFFMLSACYCIYNPGTLGNCQTSLFFLFHFFFCLLFFRNVLNVCTLQQISFQSRAHALLLSYLLEQNVVFLLVGESYLCTKRNVLIFFSSLFT